MPAHADECNQRRHSPLSIVREPRVMPDPGVSGLRCLLAHGPTLVTADRVFERLRLTRGVPLLADPHNAPRAQTRSRRVGRYRGRTHAPDVGSAAARRPQACLRLRLRDRARPLAAALRLSRPAASPSRDLNTGPGPGLRPNRAYGRFGPTSPEDSQHELTRVRRSPSNPPGRCGRIREPSARNRPGRFGRRL